MKKTKTYISDEKPILRTFSWFRFLHLWLGRLFLVAIIISAIANFKANYVATSIAIIVCGFLLIYLGQFSIIVYHDRVEYKSGTLFNLFDKHKIFYYKDIKQISIDGNKTLAVDILEDLITNFVNEPFNRIIIELNNGETRLINTNIYKSDLRKALKCILIAYRKLKEHR